MKKSSKKSTKEIPKEKKWEPPKEGEEGWKEYINDMYESLKYGKM